MELKSTGGIAFLLFLPKTLRHLSLFTIDLNYRGLASVKPETFIAEVEDFVSVEDDCTVCLDEAGLMARHSCFGTAPCNPLTLLTNNPIAKDPIAFLRQIDTVTSMGLSFFLRLIPWAILAFLVNHAVYHWGLAGNFKEMEPMHKTLGIIVSFTIGFKNKTAYDRWGG